MGLKYDVMIFYATTVPYQCYYIKGNSETNVAFKITFKFKKENTLYGKKKIIISLMKVSTLTTTDNY